MMPSDRSTRGWEVAVAVFVVLGCFATAGYALIETFWG
jgi:hypothetical protein